MHGLRNSLLGKANKANQGIHATFHWQAGVQPVSGNQDSSPAMVSWEYKHHHSKHAFLLLHKIINVDHYSLKDTSNLFLFSFVFIIAITVLVVYIPPLLWKSLLDTICKEKCLFE